MVRGIHLLHLFLLLISMKVASSAHFKIAIPSAEEIHSRYFKRGGGACTDYKPVHDVSTLKFPPGFEFLPKPWILNTRTTVATSETVNRDLYSLFAEKVPGLGGKTVQDVLTEFQTKRCLCLPYGGPVRDQFLGATPNDVDVESNCKVDQLYQICEQAWGKSNCGLNIKPDIEVLHIGNAKVPGGTTDIIDATNWERTFFGNGVYLEYTTNSLGYVAGGKSLSFIIDITGTGITDTCNRKIRIPVSVQNRQMWVKVSPGKVYRFWKLRVKKYTAIDSDTMKFIVSQAQQITLADKAGFQRFYCGTVLTGRWSKTKGICTIAATSCNKAKSNKKEYDAFFEEDLGDFWTTTMKRLIDGMECHSCPCMRLGYIYM